MFLCMFGFLLLLSILVVMLSCDCKLMKHSIPFIVGLSYAKENQERGTAKTSPGEEI